jgi:hypothetical protein
MAHRSIHGLPTPYLLSSFPIHHERRTFRSSFGRVAASVVTSVKTIVNRPSLVSGRRRLRLDRITMHLTSSYCTVSDVDCMETHVLKVFSRDLVMRQCVNLVSFRSNRVLALSQGNECTWKTLCYNKNNNNDNKNKNNIIIIIIIIQMKLPLNASLSIIHDYPFKTQIYSTSLTTHEHC